IRNLRDTTQKNTEQDWLKTNLAKFSRMLQGQRDLSNIGRMVLSELCPVVAAQHAEFYVFDGSDDALPLTLLAGYAAEKPRSASCSTPLKPTCGPRASEAIAVAGPAASDSPGTIAKYQRGAAREGPSAGASESGGGTQEPGSRASSPGARGKSQAACPDVQV